LRKKAMPASKGAGIRVAAHTQQYRRKIKRF